MGKIAKGIKWTALEKILVQLVQFVLSIIIARLISPSEYGILAILMVFINVPQVFIDCGLGNALIYRNKLEEDSLQTTFTFNLAVSVLFVILMYVFAPYIEHFYNLSGLTLYLRITSLALLTNSLVVVPTSILKIKFDFKSLSVANIVSTIVSGLLGVVMAYSGFGIWALIGQFMSRSVILAIILSYSCKWLPRFVFKMKAFLPLYRYGINIFSVGIITKITEEGISFIIAKKLNPWNLGIFTRSLQFASFSQAGLSSVIQTVMFPSFSSVNKDKKQFDELFIKSIEYQSAFSFPLWFILAVLAKPIVVTLLTVKWIEVVPLLQVVCMGRMLVLVANITEQALMAKGRSDLFLKQQIFKMIFKIIVVCCALPYGLFMVAIADGLSSLVSFFITNFYAKHINVFGICKQLKTIKEYFFSSIFASVFGYLSIFLIDNNYMSIIVFSIVFMACYYIFVEKVYKKKIFSVIISKIKS